LPFSIYHPSSVTIALEEELQSDRRILFVCAKLDNGGAERHWAGLLPALHERGLGVRVVAIEGSGRALQQLRDCGIPVRELGRKGLSSLAALPALMQERGSDPTAIVSFGYNAHVLSGAFARSTSTPHVVNWHRQQGWPMNHVERNAIRLTARAGAGVISVTDAQGEDLVRLGFPLTRIRVVPNGVPPPALLDIPREQLRGRLKLPGDKFLAVLVARLRPEKRVVDFIDAIALARDQRPDIMGVIVGDGPMTDELEQYAARRDASIRFVGHQSDPPMWMLAADVVCLTSRFEALPISLVEAISCGRPCIATDVGGTRDIVEEGVNGRLVAPEDSRTLAATIVDLVQRPDLRTEMGRASHARWHARFSFDAMVDRYASLLSAAEGPPTAWTDD
jgi:glycosyltransferase involved in cell wall biosynthesis